MFWEEWEESGSESNGGPEIGQVREACQRLPPGWAPKQVLNSSCHRKKCSSCGCDWWEGDWYFTDVSCPWGAQKICLDCIEDWLVDNGVSDSWGEEEEGEEVFDEYDEAGTNDIVNREPQPQSVEEQVVKVEKQDVKLEVKDESEIAYKTEVSQLKKENVETKLEEPEQKLNIGSSQSNPTQTKIEDITVKQENQIGQRVKRELDVERGDQLPTKKIKTEL